MCCLKIQNFYSLLPGIVENLLIAVWGEELQATD
jgi:hypothetical protein